jgi:hypothetical protein
MIGFLGVIAALAAVIAIPVAIFAAVRVVGGIVKALDRGAVQDDRFEARLARIEEAIDAMASQIERLRLREEGSAEPSTGARYALPRGEPVAPSGDDRPTL